MQSMIGRCEYCGFDGTADARVLATFQVDHIVPGFEGEFNYAFACGLCNRLKSNYDPSQGTGPASNLVEREKLLEKARVHLSGVLNAGNPFSDGHRYRVLQLLIFAKRKVEDPAP